MKSLAVETSKPDARKYPDVFSLIGWNEMKFKILQHSFDMDRHFFKMPAIETIEKFAAKWQDPQVSVSVLCNVDHLAVVKTVAETIVYKTKVLRSRH